MIINLKKDTNVLFPILSTRGKSRFILKKSSSPPETLVLISPLPPTTSIYCTSVIKLIRVIEVWGLSNCYRILLIVWSSLLFSEGQTM